MKLGTKTIIFILILCLCSPFFSVFAADNAVSLVVSAVGDARVGEEIIIKITITKPAVNLAGLEFTLDYNKSGFSPVVTKNTEENTEMDSLIKKLPNGWEQMCYHSQSEGRYYFRFAMPEGGGYLNTAEGIVLEIPFKVNAAGVFEFSVLSEEIVAIVGDADFSLRVGKGMAVSVAAASEKEKFGIDLGETQAVQENGLYYLNATVTNLGDAEGIIGLEFALEYDKTVFKPYITQNDNNQMDVFMASMPQNSWEQMCTLYEESGKYVLRFAALHAESLTQSEILKKGESIKLSIPFYVIGTEGAVTSFKVNSATAIGINNKNGFIIGLGDSKTVSVEKGNSPIPAGLYDIKDGYLTYVYPETDIGAFLQPLNGVYLTKDGKKIESGTVCTGQTLTNGGVFSVIVVVLGDMNGNGKIDARDYLLAKRTYFGTYEADKGAQLAADINGNGKVDARDYLLLKRAYFGTYTLKIS